MCSVVVNFSLTLYLFDFSNVFLHCPVQSLSVYSLVEGLHRDSNKRRPRQRRRKKQRERRTTITSLFLVLVVVVAL